MTKVEYKGYRVWATLQASGKYRAWFFNSVGVIADVSRVIEADTEVEAINKAKQFLDGGQEQRRLHPSVIAGPWILNP
jgi:hypothetical protein